MSRLASLALVGLIGLGSTFVAAPAHAAKVTKIYINGVDATGVKSTQLNGVDVRIDSEGNLWIDAPRYKINVDRPQTAAAPPATTEAPATVPAGHHWLVTQDSGSAGQILQVFVNGTMVREIRSGQAQLILDIGEFLKPGSNVISVVPVAGDAEPSGGALKVHLGEGSNEGGTLRMSNPQLTYTRTGQDPADERSLEYVVQ
ncbi:MAG: hypothetical protein H6742_07265 [Alphaproteobacteria bacterium]|nr:hypothetical protein [Alphaproteobacteria bacterium]